MVEILFYNIFGQIIFGILGSMSLILWVYCIINHNKVSSNGFLLILLIFLSSLYLPFYFYKFYLKSKNVS